MTTDRCLLGKEGPTEASPKSFSMNVACNLALGEK